MEIASTLNYVSVSCLRVRGMISSSQSASSLTGSSDNSGRIYVSYLSSLFIELAGKVKMGDFGTQRTSTKVSRKFFAGYHYQL